MKGNYYVVGASTSVCWPVIQLAVFRPACSQSGAESFNHAGCFCFHSIQGKCIVNRKFEKYMKIFFPLEYCFLPTQLIQLELAAVFIACFAVTFPSFSDRAPTNCCCCCFCCCYLLDLPTKGAKPIGLLMINRIAILLTVVCPESWFSKYHGFAERKA